MIVIKSLLFKLLAKTDLDVLEDAEDNKTQNYIELPIENNSWLKSLPTTDGWSESGKSEIAETTVVTKSGIKETLCLRIQHGKREMGRLNLLRTRAISTWSEPVQEDRPSEDMAMLFLVRDNNDNTYARLVRDFNDVNSTILSQINRFKKRTGFVEFPSHGHFITEDPWVAEVLEALKTKKNVILYGPPGTGKTHLMSVIRESFGKTIPKVVFNPDNYDNPFESQDGILPLAPDPAKAKTTFVTFHQSYSYESFVSGLRPVVSGRDLKYEVVKGPVIELAENANQDNGSSLLLIDEINRGNTAEILGELITIIESDKRLHTDGKPHKGTVGVKLPYLPENCELIDKISGEFRLPDRFYVLASMNSVDRSVAPLDSALRRRFQLIDIPPDIGALRSRATQIAKDYDQDPVARAKWDSLSELACSVLEAINKRIGVLRGSDFMLGQGYFWDVFKEEAGETPPSVIERESRFVRAFAQSILPQLREMFRDDPSLIEYLLGTENKGHLYEIVGENDPQAVGSGYVKWLPRSLADTTGWIECCKRVAKIGALEPAEDIPPDENDE